MKFMDEFRNPDSIDHYAQAIEKMISKPWNIMEICGGQTHAIMRFGLTGMLPEKVTLLHGPGCPVCVTPLEKIDKAIEIASRTEVIFCSFGDMLRIPGSKQDLLSVKAAGGDVRSVYSPLDAVMIAESFPHKEIVFFAVGFETTAPANAMAVYHAAQKNLKNFSLLTSHVLVPPAIDAILSSPENKVNGFLAAGHVCTIMGYHAYEPLAAYYKVPIIVTGFEPADIMQALYMCIRQLEEGRYEVENQYSRVVSAAGNLPAQHLLKEIFEITPQKWRGIGEIEASGLRLTEQYSRFDAEKKFGCVEKEVQESRACISGLILQGIQKPQSCPAFGTSCTPEHPLGATMVSNEGACSAYYRYRSREA